MATNLTSPDASTVTVPAPLADTEQPSYPRAMYHPTKGSTYVDDSNAESALVASDALWSETDPNATT